MVFLWVFIGGGVFALGCVVIGWFGFKHIVHVPKMRVMLPKLAEMERIERERRAREAEGS